MDGYEGDSHTVTMLVTLVLILFFCVAIPGTAEAVKYRQCDSEAKANLKLAVRYIKSIKTNLVKDYEFDTRLPRKAKRVKRRIKRSLGKMKIVCDKSFACRNNVYGRSRTSLTKRVHVCYDAIKKSEKKDHYCTLVGTVAHEFAHSVGMPSNLGHNDPGKKFSDATYEFGWFAETLCLQDKLKRPLVADPKWVAPKTPRPDRGIVLYAKKNFRHRGYNLTGSDRDLRLYEGRNNSTTSIRVLSGVWETCKKPGHRGWCRVFTKSHPNLKKIHWNNRISSVIKIRHTYQKGIVVYKNKRYRGPYRHITGAEPNLKKLKINNDISSIRVLSGRWQVCKKRNYRKCKTITGSLKKVGKIKMNNKISSIRPL